MILTVDIGNTNIKIGAFDGDKLVFVSRLYTNTTKTSDEYAANLLDIFQLYKCNHAQFDGAIISCVVPPLSQTFLQAVQTVIHTKRVYFVSPQLKTGLSIKIDSPETLGADMVCCGVAATSSQPLPCIIVSLGTATTIFAIDKDANIMGGTISPGVGISLEALSKRTAQLPYISLEKPSALIGTNTIDCMTSGAVYGTACMIDGIVSRMKDILGEDTTVVACGGIAQHIVGYCQQNITVNDNLVLEGLKILYDKNDV